MTTETDPPRVIGEHRRKKKGVRGQWYWRVQCPFCGRSHAHVTAGVQLSHCMDRPAQVYEVVPTTKETESMDTRIPQGQEHVVPAKGGNRSNLDPHVRGTGRLDDLKQKPATQPFPITPDTNGTTSVTG